MFMAVRLGDSAAAKQRLTGSPHAIKALSGLATHGSLVLVIITFCM